MFSNKKFLMKVTHIIMKEGIKMSKSLKLNTNAMTEVINMLNDLKKIYNFQKIEDEYVAFSCSFGGCSGSCYGCSGCTSCSSCSGGCSGGFTYG